MGSEPEEPEDPQEPGQERPSKSARKRAAHAAQDLGEHLIKLRDAQLEALALPEQLPMRCVGRGASPAAALARASTSTSAS